MSQTTTRSIIKSFGITSSATLVAIFISALTNKVLSLYAGPEGIGLMGIFRNFGSLLGGVLTFGYTTILVREISCAKQPEEKRLAALSGIVLLVLQLFIAALLAAFWVGPITRSLFSADLVSNYRLEIQIVIFMAVVNILLQVVFAVLRGEANIRILSFVQILTAVSSLLLIVPLLKMGSIGLAINVGSGSLIGGIVGLYLLRHLFKDIGKLKLWKSAFQRLRGRTRSSFLITIQTFVTVGSLLWVQSQIQKALGLEFLGNYNAALLVLDTGVLVMMSSVRSYLLPVLARLETAEQKSEFFLRFLNILMSIALVSSLLLSFLSPWVIRLLFSSKFGGAETLLPLFGLSLFGLTLVWLYNTLLLHFERTWAFTIIDCTGALVFAALSVLMLHSRSSLSSVVWIYSLAPVFTAALYLAYARRTYGRAFSDLKSLAVPLLGFFLLGYALSLNSENSYKPWILLSVFGVALYHLRDLFSFGAIRLPFKVRKPA